MSVSLNLNSSSQQPQGSGKAPSSGTSPECIERLSRSLTIGLVNNMPDAALEATERQFLALLESASDGFSIRLSLHSLPGVERNEWGTHHVSKYYSSVEKLRDQQIDALIVTGREPLSPNLADEPYWESFTALLEWARNNTYSSVWSCLAAHAAVLHMDGICRVRNGHKYCGVFDCAQLSDHPLIAGAPESFNLPHSRWNGLPEDELTARGYRVLTRADGAGVDTFIKQDRSLFVFFQGHPEYEPHTLLLEYRRDVGRFLRGETEAYPILPRGYFDERTTVALMAFQQRAMQRRDEALLTELQQVLGAAELQNSWQPTATCIYRNWLEYLSEQKRLRLEGKKAVAEAQSAGLPASHIAAAADASRPVAYSAGLNQGQPPLIRATR